MRAAASTTGKTPQKGGSNGDLGGKMSGGLEAAGDAITGALVAGAVKPAHGEGEGRTAESACLNCGTLLTDAYCSACGQHAHVHRTLLSLWHDIAHGVFHFEGKVWRTIPMLIAHPGALTRRYIHGQRARFVSPLALFLFAVFLMFATMHGFSGELDAPILTPAQRAAAVQKIDGKIGEAEAELKQAVAEHAQDPTETPEGELTGLRASLAALKLSRSKIAAGSEGKGEAAGSFTFTDLTTGWPALDAGIARANRNPGLALYKIQSSAYKYAWALIPISVPFVALMFLWRRQYKLYDHAIFVTYSLAFMLLLVTLLSLMVRIGVPDGWIVLSALIVPPVHMFAQLRGAYELRKRSAAWRTVALTIFAFTAFAAFAALLLVLGLTD